MAYAHIFASGNGHPPHIDHIVVGTASVLVLVQNACNMAVTVIAAYVVHLSLIVPVGLKNSVVVPLRFTDIQRNILMRLSKG